MSESHENVDPQEIAKFDGLAARWWDPEGDFRPLHELNPLRLSFIERAGEVRGKHVLDVGCGGGILSEALARRGATVTGIDMAEEALSVARLHQEDEQLGIDYRQTTAEGLARTDPQSFDIVTCMELLEHVPEPGSLVSACAKLVKPGGEVFFSTINRNPRAYALAVVAAEYVLKLLPRGTHDYEKFIRPSELGAYCRSAGLTVRSTAGLKYNPVTGGHALSSDTGVNYVLRATRPDDCE